MKKCELILIINPTLAENERANIFGEMTKEIQKKGILFSIDEYGVKNTAYTYKGFNQGYYYIFNFCMDSEHIEKLKAIIKNKDSIIHNIFVID